jgi:hypothetical protein
MANRKKRPKQKTQSSRRRLRPSHNQYHRAPAEMARQQVPVELVQETQAQIPAQEAPMADGVSDECLLSAESRSLQCQMSILRSWRYR